MLREAFVILELRCFFWKIAESMNHKSCLFVCIGKVRLSFVEEADYAFQFAQIV